MKLALRNWELALWGGRAVRGGGTDRVHDKYLECEVGVASLEKDKNKASKKDKRGGRGLGDYWGRGQEGKNFRRANKCKGPGAGVCGYDVSPQN